MSERRFPPTDESRFKATLRHYHVPKSLRRKRTPKEADLWNRRIIVILRVGGITLLVALLIVILVALFVEMAV